MVNPIISRKEIIVEPDAILKDGRRKNWFWDNNDVFESDLSSNAILVIDPTPKGGGLPVGNFRQVSTLSGKLPFGAAL